jgi:hypothetical protein
MHFNWESISQEALIKTFIRATVQITGRVVLGFPEALSGVVVGSVMLPEIALSVIKSGDNPALDIAVTHFELAEPFGQEHEAELREFIVGECRTSALRFLSEIAKQHISTERVLIPPGLIVLLLEDELPEEISSGAIVIRQQSGTDPSYVVEGNVLYWGLELSEVLTDCLHP